MTSVVLLVAWMLAVPAQEPTEKKIPNDSVEVSSRGCIKGRVFATGARTADEEGTRVGPDISDRSFRLAGPREAMDQVKKYDGQWVEMRGHREEGRPGRLHAGHQGGRAPAWSSARRAATRPARSCRRRRACR